MAQWVTGFCDRSGSFGLTMYRKGTSWHFKVVFEVLLNIKDIHILETLKSFFGVGKIYVTNTTATYRVTGFSNLTVIINHFIAYPLISSKHVVFTLWSEAVNLIGTSQHLVPSTFAYIQTIYAALGRGPSAAVMQAFPSLTPMVLPTHTVTVTSNNINPWWISGYLTLYCSFILTIAGGGWGDSVYNRHMFTVSFTMLDFALAEVISSHIGLSLYVRTNEQRVDVMSQSMKEALNLIDFLDVYPLQSYKQEHYEVWQQYVKDLSDDQFDDLQRRSSNPGPGRFRYYNKLADRLANLRR